MERESETETYPSSASISLYVVPTPIGNMGDMTFRALETLQKVDTILAEDTRVSAFLLKKYAVSKPVKPYHSFNEHKALSSLLNRMKSGETMAILSDAGTPGIADPGFLIVRACLKEGLHVSALPGPTALIPALILSGFPTDRFVFEGFLPHKKGKKTAILALLNEERTTVFYESPHRLLKTLTMIAELLGTERLVSVSKELTKIYEETYTSTANHVLKYFGDKEKTKGEYVIVVAGIKVTI